MRPLAAGLAAWFQLLGGKTSTSIGPQVANNGAPIRLAGLATQIGFPLFLPQSGESRR
jgi:hypothetical protein